MRNVFLFLSLIAIATGCFKDTEDTTEIIHKPIPPIIISSTDVVVSVQDEFGKPVSGMTARFNKATQLIENHGTLYFKGENINKETELLTLTHPSGKSYDFNLYNVENQINYHQVIIFSDTKIATFNSQQPIYISLPSNSFELHFKPQVFQSGTLDYTGEINAEYRDYNVSDPIHLQALPGGKILYDEGVKKVILPEKAFYVNLMSTDEKRLSWKEAHKADFPVVFKEGTFLLRYDEEAHIWHKMSDISHQKSIDIKSNGYYMIAELAEFHIATGMWTNQGVAIPNLPVNVKSSTFESIVHTTQSGFWEAVVPAGQNISFTPFVTCLSSASPLEIFTTGQKTQTGVKDFSVSSFTNLNVKGRLLNCQHEEIVNGFIHIQSDGETKVLLVENPDFEFLIPSCQTEDWSVTAHFGEAKSTKILPYKNNIDLGNIYVCPELNENYVTFHSGPDYTNLIQPVVVLNDGQTMVIKIDNGIQNFYFKFAHQAKEGLLANESANIIWQDPDFSSAGIEIDCPTSQSCGFEEIEMTSYPENGWIRGRFTGRFWTRTYQPLTAKYQNISADFQVKR